MVDMKGDWNERAKENAEFYIASAKGDRDQFRESGARDVELFFAGLELLLHSDASVLDIGCGIGRMDEHIAPRVSQLVGLDVSGEMVRNARERLAHLPNVSFEEGDGWTFGPIRDESIDVVFSHIVFQHMPREAAVSNFREAFRVLRPEGDFVFQVPEANPDSPKDPPTDDTWEMRFYSQAALRSTLESIGFEWIGEQRHEVVSPKLTFNHLRAHVRRPS